MRVPLSWLREFVATELGAEELAELITAKGVLVEGILRPWDGLDGVIAARVLEVRDHPNSDRLCLARVQTGSGEQEVVVGVRNMSAGDLVPLAGPGARVPALPQPLEAREIRGVVSNGMLCAPDELGLSTDHGGILLLNDEDWEPGTDLKTALGLDDAVLDVEVEPNRPDFLSVYGVAREVAAILGLPLASIDPKVHEGVEEGADVVPVEIVAPDRCPRYLGRIVRGISPRSSPLLAQARLTACGMRPISAVVDATNYVMLELGQPQHAFDLALLEGPGIVVRLASDGEQIVTLDDVKRTLIPDDLVIADRSRAVAIAGVMGSSAAEVSATTKDVFLECAYFTRSGVLLTARRLGLHTEASHRYERGADPELPPLAVDRCAQLIADWGGGSVSRGVAGGGAVPERRVVALRPARATALLGYPVSPEDAGAVFDALTFPHRDSGDEVAVDVPGYRVDIEREVDLIEEVVRIQGYDRVGSSLPRAPHPGGTPRDRAFADRARDVLVRAGLREVRPVPFSSEEDLELTGDADAIGVTNPLRAEEGFLRTRLIPGLLRTVARNQASGARSITIFEVGTVFRTGEPVQERRKVAFALAGSAGERWFEGSRELDALDARGTLDALMEGLAIAGWAVAGEPGGPFHPGRSGWIEVDGRRAGVLGEIHPRTSDRLEIRGRVAVAELELQALLGASSTSITYQDVPRFPPVRRDLAFVLPVDVPAAAVQRSIEEAGGDLLARCELFDLFEGGSLPAGTKSLAFSAEFRATDRTLTDEEAAGAVATIAARLEAEFEARLRSS